MDRKIFIATTAACLFCLALPLAAQQRGELESLIYPKSYENHRVSSFDPSGANDDGQWINFIKRNETRTLAEIEGPGIITHIWFTIATPDQNHLKKILLRMYWDGEENPSVETPVGDFFGLGLGEYHYFESGPVMIGTQNALNCFWRMPFRKSARITVTYESDVGDEEVAKMSEARRAEFEEKEKISAFYFFIDYERHDSLPDDVLYFHAQYRQAAPCDGYTDWYSNGQPEVNRIPNLDGAGNYVYLEAEGRGHYVGVFHAVLQNQDDWWGEGDDMIFVDGAAKPTLHGTGTEDYFGGAWCYGQPFDYRYIGCKSPEGEFHVRGAKWHVYRLHLESPIAFRKDIRVTIEHGHANHRSDNFYTCAFWYQDEPHGKFPAMPDVRTRIPRKINLAGKGFDYKEQVPR